MTSSHVSPVLLATPIELLSSPQSENSSEDTHTPACGAARHLRKCVPANTETQRLLSPRSHVTCQAMTTQVTFSIISNSPNDFHLLPLSDPSISSSQGFSQMLTFCFGGLVFGPGPDWVLSGHRAARLVKVECFLGAAGVLHSAAGGREVGRRVEAAKQTCCPGHNWESMQLLILCLVKTAWHWSQNPLAKSPGA